MKDNFPRTALNCRNLSCNNTMRTGEIYIDGFCGSCYGNRNQKKDYNEIINTGHRFEISKTIQALDKVDMAIREKRFPILYVTKEQTAVIISQEEYKRLKKLDKDIIDFDKIRDDIANIVGLPKEKLFPNIYGDEEEIVKFFVTTFKKYISKDRYDNTFIGRKNDNEKRPKE